VLTQYALVPHHLLQHTPGPQVPRCAWHGLLQLHADLQQLCGAADEAGHGSCTHNTARHGSASALSILHIFTLLTNNCYYSRGHFPLHSKARQKHALALAPAITTLLWLLAADSKPARQQVCKTGSSTELGTRCSDLAMCSALPTLCSDGCLPDKRSTFSGSTA